MRTAGLIGGDQTMYPSEPDHQPASLLVPTNVDDTSAMIGPTQSHARIGGSPATTITGISHTEQRYTLSPR